MHYPLETIPTGFMQVQMPPHNSNSNPPERQSSTTEPKNHPQLNSPDSDYQTNSVNFNTTNGSLSPNPADSNYVSSGDDKSPKAVKQGSKASSNHGSSVLNSPPHGWNGYGQSGTGFGVVLLFKNVMT